MKRVLLLPACLVAACAAFEADVLSGAPPEDGGVVELVEAGATALDGPAVVFAGSAPAFTVRGRLPDPCTRFDRIETRVDAEGTVTLVPWAVRPVGPCAGDPTAFSASVTVFGLHAGRHRLVAGDGWPARDLVVLAAREADCAGSDAIPIASVRAPPATHPAGSAVVLAVAVLPTACHGPPSLRAEPAADGFALFAESPRCGPVDDASACPPLEAPVPLSVDLGPVPEGSHALGGPDVETAGRIEVVPTGDCAFEPLAIETVRGPRVAAVDEPPAIAADGRLAATCAAVDPPVVSVEDDGVAVTILARTCTAACAPASTPARVTVAVAGLEPGWWPVTVNGRALDRPIAVGEAGACDRRPLPESAVGGLLVTEGLYTDLAFAAAPAGRPIDVHLVGTLPDGCWADPRLLADGPPQDAALSLRTDGRFCDLGCAHTEDGGPDPLSRHGGVGTPPDGEADEPPPVIADLGGDRGFAAGVALPGGLAPGSWSITVDGRPAATVEVE